MGSYQRASSQQRYTFNSQGNDRGVRSQQNTADEDFPIKIPPEVIAEISEKVYQLFLNDLRIARERRFRLW